MLLELYVLLLAPIFWGEHHKEVSTVISPGPYALYSTRLEVQSPYKHQYRHVIRWPDPSRVLG